MVGVAVRVRALVGGLELELDQAEIVGSDLDRGDAVVRAQRLALAGVEEHGAGVGEPVARRAASTLSKPPGSPRSSSRRCSANRASGRVEVEEAGRHRAPEPVHEAGRRADGAAWADEVLLVADADRQLALEHVERVGVLTVEVEIGPRPRGREPRLGHRQLLEPGLEHDPAAEERLAFAGAVVDAVHAWPSMNAAGGASRYG